MNNTKKANPKPQNEPYLALYRKYRPQDFNSVLGQDLAVKALENSINNNKIHHAYIFYGDRGIGKTTLARIFAKSIGSTDEDIFEINSASNTGVDDMRLIIEATQVGTFGSRYKVYIFDEVHMLSTSAFNALLKVLEEPPAHVIFILATTRKDKIPATIISRCQVFNLISPNIETLEEIILKVAKAEHRELDKESILKIAEMGHGSFRDTLGVLEKVFTVIDRSKITLKDLENIFNDIKDEEVYKVLIGISENNIPELFKTIKNLNLKTSELIMNFYLKLVKLFELGLYLRFNSLEDTKNNLYQSSNEETLKKIQILVENSPKLFSSKNLLKLLELEGGLRNDSNLSELVLITGLIDLIETNI